MGYSIKKLFEKFLREASLDIDKFTRDTGDSGPASGPVDSWSSRKKNVPTTGQRQFSDRNEEAWLNNASDEKKSWYEKVNKQTERFLGKDWKDKIAKSFKKGSAPWEMLDGLWREGYDDDDKWGEASGEIAHFYDIAKGGVAGLADYGYDIATMTPKPAMDYYEFLDAFGEWEDNGHRGPEPKEEDFHRPKRQ